MPNISYSRLAKTFAKTTSTKSVQVYKSLNVNSFFTRLKLYLSDLIRRNPSPSIDEINKSRHEEFATIAKSVYPKIKNLNLVDVRAANSLIVFDGDFYKIIISQGKLIISQPNNNSSTKSTMSNSYFHNPLDKGQEVFEVDLLYGDSLENLKRNLVLALAGIPYENLARVLSDNPDYKVKSNVVSTDVYISGAQIHFKIKNYKESSECYYKAFLSCCDKIASDNSIDSFDYQTQLASLFELMNKCWSLAKLSADQITPLNVIIKEYFILRISSNSSRRSFTHLLYQKVFNQDMDNDPDLADADQQTIINMLYDKPQWVIEFVKNPFRDLSFYKFLTIVKPSDIQQIICLLNCKDSKG